MPPTLALFLTLGFIGFLFWRDFREKPNVSGAVWLPILWMFLIASKPVSKWLALLGLSGFGATSAEEGSSLDAFVYLVLIVSGIYVLSRRKANLSEIARNNRWLMVFFLYCFLAIFWSDYPFVSFKRWLKVLGHPVMILILFTERDPEEALATIMKRCAYVLFPISILWLKYFPTLGRRSSDWGTMTNVGIAEGKNELGSACYVFGIFFVWYVLQLLKRAGGLRRWYKLRWKLIFTGGLSLLVAYCLLKAHSATSLICFMIGAMIIIVLGFRVVDKRRIGLYTAVAIIVMVVAQLTFDIYGTVIALTGHEPTSGKASQFSTIEGRGRLWDTLLDTDTNPIFGTGFESYWLGDRIAKIWAMPEFWWHPNEAHNGYLETYINLGFLGVFLLVGLIFITYSKCRRDLLQNFEWGRLTLAYLVAILAHNWTEAGFKGLSINYLIFFIIAIDYPKLRIGSAPPPVEEEDSTPEVELVYSGSSSWLKSGAT
jgi:exopolysaccharide production protein ExoQ